MGLFSKKTFVCSKCGREFLKRASFTGNLCDTCLETERYEYAKLSQTIEGYVKYGKEILNWNYSKEQLAAIRAHRDAMLEKMTNPYGICIDELQQVSQNCRMMPQEQLEDVIVRISNASLESTMGSAFNDMFIAPTSYDGMLVDMNDVFAVCYTTSHSLSEDKVEAILCLAFTNDPYAPVVPIVFVGKIGMFAMFKSRKGREGVRELFKELCPNLTYPVDDLKVLKKTLMGNNEVRGNVPYGLMMHILNSNVSSLFRASSMSHELQGVSRGMLSSIGYVAETDIAAILRLDKFFERRFWDKLINRMAKSYK